MSTELVFILFVFIPGLILGIFMTKAQRKFLRFYREIINPNRPIFSDELAQLFRQNPNKFIRFIKQDFAVYLIVGWKMYWKRYKNPILEKEAALVRKLIILTFVIPLIGFVLTILLIGGTK